MSDLRPSFWELPLADLTHTEWEALCDGCGKCCLNKLEDEDTGKVDLTRISCRLLDGATCLCRHYETRHEHVPECIVMTAKTLKDNMYWLPQTCAYRLRANGKPLRDWHYLISGDRQTVHEAGITMRNRILSESYVAEDDWDDYIIKEPT